MAWPLLATAAPGQVAPNRATVYLNPTDVSDARAVWLNPAGLGRVAGASVDADVTVGDPGAGGRLRQLTLGFDSRGFSFGYQRDLFATGVQGHTYRVALASGRGGLAAGFGAALYRGATSGTGWNVGMLYEAAAAFTAGVAVENIGQPTVRDSTLRVTYVPGGTLRLFGARAAVSAHARLPVGGAARYALGLRAGFRQGTSLPLGVLARVDVDAALRHAGFAVGLAFGGQDVAGAVASLPGHGGVDALSLYGVSTRPAGSPRRE